MEHQDDDEQGKESAKGSYNWMGAHRDVGTLQRKTGMLAAKMDADTVSPSVEGAKKGDRVTCRLFSFSAFC